MGQGAVQFYLPLNVQLPNDFFAQAVVVTKGLQQRERVKANWNRLSRTSSRALSDGFIRWNSDHLSGGRCSIASAGRTLTKCGPSLSRWRTPWDQTRALAI